MSVHLSTHLALCTQTKVDIKIRLFCKYKKRYGTIKAQTRHRDFPTDLLRCRAALMSAIRKLAQNEYYCCKKVLNCKMSG